MVGLPTPLRLPNNAKQEQLVDFGSQVSAICILGALTAPLPDSSSGPRLPIYFECGVLGLWERRERYQPWMLDAVPSNIGTLRLHPGLGTSANSQALIPLMVPVWTYRPPKEPFYLSVLSLLESERLLYPYTTIIQPQTHESLPWLAGIKKTKL